MSAAYDALSVEISRTAAALNAAAAQAGPRWKELRMGESAGIRLETLMEARDIVRKAESEAE